jgi:hypothetical protein
MRKRATSKVQERVDALTALVNAELQVDRQKLADWIAVVGPMVPSPYVMTREEKLRRAGLDLAEALRGCAALSPEAARVKHEALLGWAWANGGAA